jgi:hypothetical protein
VAGLDSSVLIESIQSENRDSLTITTRKPIPLKNAYMLMLLHLNEDFDDDLLLEACDLLDCLQ